ncbi:MAG TPA: type I 3-dehydroquinate dehydratase [Thermoplasmata archaeon]|nr:type I 3-dehydroquinate dehydratase [Thermoplasmata archaeon]
MTEPRPLIVVSLPARTPEEAAPQIAAAAAAGADAAELRLDRWSSEDRARVGSVFPAALPLLATLRSTAEGGEGPDAPADRAEAFRAIARHPFRWIDLERARDDAVAGSLPPIARVGRVVSAHLARYDPDGWPKLWLELARHDGIGKLVLPASVPAVLDEIVPTIAGRRPGPVIVHTLGASGPLLRALARRLALPMVFAALPESAGAGTVEPSQLPVDRLRPFLDAEGEPPLFAVAGRPIGHSQSPAVHSDWMRRDGRDGLYLPLEFEDDDEFLRSIPLLAANGFRGLNVTQPFKSAAFEGATDARASAELCRAANCLVLREDEVVAENTDLAAIVRRLEELRRDGRWTGRSVTVLGTGGAARASLAAARELGVVAQVVGRRPSAAERIAEEFGARAVRAGDAAPTELLVNATSVGRDASGAPELPLAALLAPSATVLDWVYRPERADVADAARAAGASYEDGWRLFVYQAAASYALFWGQPPSDEAIAATISEGSCAA